MNTIHSSTRRQGKVLVLMAIMLPTLFTFLLLVLDGSNVTHHFRDAQQIADTAALSGADEIYLGSSSTTVENLAREDYRISLRSVADHIRVEHREHVDAFLCVL